MLRKLVFTPGLFAFLVLVSSVAVELPLSNASADFEGRSVYLRDDSSDSRSLERDKVEDRTLGGIFSHFLLLATIGIRIIRRKIVGTSGINSVASTCSWKIVFVAKEDCGEPLKTMKKVHPSAKIQ